MMAAAAAAASIPPCVRRGATATSSSTLISSLQHPRQFFGRHSKVKKNYGKGTAILAATASSIAETLVTHVLSLGQSHEQITTNLFLGVGVGLPCTVMECGDIIYRSTLPRSSGTITPIGVTLALATLSYLWATPGVAPGFWDMFVLAFIERLFRPSYRKVLYLLL